MYIYLLSGEKDHTIIETVFLSFLEANILQKTKGRKWTFSNKLFKFKMTVMKYHRTWHEAQEIKNDNRTHSFWVIYDFKTDL